MATTAYPQPYNDDDPFAGGTKTPALSWKGLPIGSTFVLQVLEPAKLLHSRNFETNQPDYWDEEKTQPKMSAVVNVRVLDGPHSVGETRSVWAQKPSNLFMAIAQAQTEAGARIAPGGILRLRFSGETPHENRRYSPIKNYQAKYEAPAASDAFADSAPHAPAQPGATSPQAQAGWPQQPTRPATAQPAARTW